MVQSRKKVLVVGGAGYVGSAVCAWLLDRGYDVWVLDDLSTGHREFVLGQHFVYGRAGDRGVVAPLLARERFDCVMHFAAKSLVGESVLKPDLYHENNVLQTQALLAMMLEAGTRKFIFSSTCAIFGDPGGDPGTAKINEDCPKNPINPYGRTKLQAERLMERLAREKGLQAIALRYFNAAGAESQGRVGEWHGPETHLIPNILRACVRGEAVTIHGSDYPTPDGTCVRDYIHVSDLAEAHGQAMLRLFDQSAGGLFEGYNLGSESGYSVLEVVGACEKVVGKKIRAKLSARRPGDPPRLVGDSARARATLGFQPKEDLGSIIKSAWRWEQKRPAGRRAVFLDRDGTLNEDPGYLSDPMQLKLLPGVGESLAKLNEAGYRLVVVSNQSGVGRGFIREETLPLIHRRLDELLVPYGARIDHYELCLHMPEDHCDCRKPKPKLILDAARELGIDLSKSFMIGDKWSDIEAGVAAGCRANILVRTGEGVSAESKLKPGEASFVSDELSGAVSWVLSQK